MCLFVVVVVVVVVYFFLAVLFCLVLSLSKCMFLYHG